MTRAEKAKAYFLEGYNCTQSVVLAFADDVDVDKTTLLKIASSFGGGMGCLREVCGAVSGMFMIAGLKHGYDEAKDVAGKKAHYQKIQELAQAYKEKNGSIVCRELLGLSQKKDSPVPEARTDAYYKKRPCADLVAMAAEIVEKMLNEENKS